MYCTSSNQLFGPSVSRNATVYGDANKCDTDVRRKKVEAYSTFPDDRRIIRHIRQNLCIGKDRDTYARTHGAACQMTITNACNTLTESGSQIEFFKFNLPK